MNSTDQRKLPAWVLWGILTGFTLLLLLVSAEILLRVVPGPWTSSFFYVYDPVLGTWHLPNFTGDNVKTDYAIRGVRFNQFGMRDPDRALAKNTGVTRVAVLGDSFIEGVQVDNDEVVTRQIETVLGPRVEVLNFATSGFGTVQEYLTYRERVRPFMPDIVVLGFYTGNDVRNNSETLEGLYNGVSDRPFVRKLRDGSWEIVPVPARPASQNPLVLFLKRNFTLYRFLWFERQNLPRFLERLPVEQARAPVENPDRYIARLFAPPTETPFIEAWEATEYLIRQLRDEAARDGARFLLVAIPDPIVFEPDPKAALEKLFGGPLPEDYDPEYPQKRLAGLSRELDIPYLDLTPEFKAYRDEHRLAFPYFAFEHDGHWSALGHRVAAAAIAKRIEGLMQNHAD